MRLVLLLLALAFATVAHAYPALPYSWSRVTEDGRAVFVMCPADSQEVYGAAKQGAMSVRAKYKKSGLYPNDGSRIPYWTVSWYAFPYDVAVSPSGEFLAVESPSGMKLDCDLAFFARNRFIKSWRIEEVAPEVLKREAESWERSTSNRSHCYIPHYLMLDKARISKDGRMELETGAGVVAFDVDSGEMLSRVPHLDTVTFPVNAAEYKAFCRVLGTTGTRNPNFISGLPEEETEVVAALPVRKPRATMPAPARPVQGPSPLLPPDPVDWRLYVVAGTTLSYALCFSAIRMRSRRASKI